MNAYLKSYVDNQNNGSSIPDDPQAIIQILLKELIKNLNVILIVESASSQKYTNSVSKALAIIYTLQNSLNFEKGGKIAENLFTVYEFCRQSILDTKDGAAKLKQSVELLTDIAEAWSQIPEVAPAA
ncbi:MAG: flagellar protein FliS [Rhodospirillaceae bacterium]